MEREPRGRVAVLVAAAAVLGGCRVSRSPANYAFAVGGHAAITSVSSPASEKGRPLGGVAGHLDAVTRFKDWTTARGRIDLMAGGNAVYGAAGRASLLAELGLSLFDGEHHLFGRAGIDGTIERDATTGLFSIEVPTLTLGYQFHGEGTDRFQDSMHFEVGPRASLDAASRGFSGRSTRDIVARPEVGGTALLMGEFVKAEFSYMHVANGPPEEVLRGDACFAAYFAFCVETRHVLTPFGANEKVDGTTGYVGFTFGMGFATGLSRSGT